MNHMINLKTKPQEIIQKIPQKQLRAFFRISWSSFCCPLKGDGFNE